MDPITLVLVIASAVAVVGPVVARGTVAVIQASRSKRGQSVADVLGGETIGEKK